MKQFRLLGMALLALIMSVGFVACSSSDDDNNGGGNNKGLHNNGKKLISISSSYEDNALSTINFVYGEDGKLIKALEKNGDYGTTRYIDVVWTNNTITLTPHSGWENPCTLTLNEGKITSADDSKHIQATIYSGNNISYTTGYNETKYTWENGNIVKVEHRSDTYTFTYYTDKINKHSVMDLDAYTLNLRLNDVIPTEYGKLILLAHPNLLGTSNKNLIKSFSLNGHSKNIYTYELDKEGYPTKITETDNLSTRGSYGTVVYVLTWE